MCTREPQLVLVSLLISWKCGAKTLNQSLSEVMQNESNSLITFDTQLKTALLHSVIGSKFSRHFFNQWEVKPKPIVARARTFSRALCRLRVITSSFDWFTGLSTSFLIGQSNYFGFGFAILNWNSLYLHRVHITLTAANPERVSRTAGLGTPSWQITWDPHLNKPGHCCASQGSSQKGEKWPFVMYIYQDSVTSLASVVLLV